jgi:DNA-binding XRE family transcriptional regulator
MAHRLALSSDGLEGCCFHHSGCGQNGCPSTFSGDIITTMTPDQCRMARAALKWSTQQLADAAGVGLNTVNRFERGSDARMSSADKMERALRRAGVAFIDENGGGVGVRLKKPVRKRRG